MVKYCVANECPIDEGRVQKLPETVISRYSNTYAKKRKRLGIWVLRNWAASNGHLHILEYLVERKYDQFDVLACRNAAKDGHLDCLKYLRETAKAPWDDWRVRLRTQEQPPRMFTIPPRQQLSSPNRLAIRAWRTAHIVIII